VLLYPEHETPYRYISVRKPSADNSNVPVWAQNSSLQTRLHMIYLRELLRSELTYLLTYTYLFTHIMEHDALHYCHVQ